MKECFGVLYLGEAINPFLTLFLLFLCFFLFCRWEFVQVEIQGGKSSVLQVQGVVVEEA